MSILAKGVKMPKNCMECEWRDAEACGECELMIGNPFKSFAEQYAHCPFQMMAKRHALVIIPPHGRLIDADAEIEVWDMGYDGVPHAVKTTVLRFLLSHLNGKVPPTIIPAEEGE